MYKVLLKNFILKIKTIVILVSMSGSITGSVNGNEVLDLWLMYK